MLKIFMDIFISVILPITIVVLTTVLKLEKTITNVCISLIPTVLLMYKYYSNKPSIYLKFLTKIKCRSNVRLNFKYYCKLKSKDENNYELLIKRYLEILRKDCDAKIKYTRLGSLNCDTIIEADSELYSFNYNNESKELIFEIKSKISFGLFIKEIKRGCRPFDTISKKYQDMFFENNIQSVEIQFLKLYDKTQISNPLFYKLYSDFDVLKSKLEYKTKNDTRVILNNSSIIFKGRNEIDMFIEDIKKQV